MDAVKKVKEYCQNELDDILFYGSDPQLALDRCYGSVMFVASWLLDYDSSEARALCSWWSDYMRPRLIRAGVAFHELYHAPKYVNTSGIGAT